ncbi:MAG TPA: hypothetical protein VK145_01245 [Candidatus Nanoarchaeia archaeon]|nr:hypothetical protein [Candidatus Nanoarchaeia archaeon]
MINPNPQKGIAILIAVIAVSAMLLIALAISDISFKEQVLTFFGRDSKSAFYAANSGIECALFHDFGGGSDGAFFFPTSTTSIIPPSVFCAAGARPISVSTNGGGTITTSSFYFNIDSQPSSCSIVRVTKTIGANGINTVIESRGYNNTCDTNSSPASPTLSSNSKRNLERALRMTY